MERQNYEAIVVAAEHAQLKKIHDVFAVEDSINTLLCKFEFRSPEWDLFTKTAVFIKDSSSNLDTIEEYEPIHVILDESNQCIVPAEVLDDHGYFSVGVFGTNGSDILPTNLIKFKCHMGCFSDGTSPSEPSQSTYNQLIEMISKKQDKLVAGENVKIDGNTISVELPKIPPDKHHVYIQGSASKEWDIVHNLEKYPSVSIVDSAGTVVVGDVKYIDENELIVSFSGAFSGKAFLN